MKRIFIVLFVVLLSACSESFTIQLAPEVNVFLSNDRNQKIHLNSEDKEYVSLNEWLNRNSSGWHSTSGRYPGGIYLTSGDNGIQVTDTHVIIYSIKAQEPKAILIQKIDKDELKSLKKLGEQVSP